MSELLIRGGTVVDGGGSRRADVAIADGRIVAVGEKLDVRGEDLDAGGCVVAPGLVDLHTHLREPGREEAETVDSGARAAALGGFTAIVAMPNTEPAIDGAAVVREVLELGRPAPCAVRVAGAITVGRRASSWRRWRRWPPSASGCSPTTATACRTAASCGGRSSTRAVSVSRSRSTARTPRWRRAVTCTKARGRAASASLASRPRPRS